MKDKGKAIMIEQWLNEPEFWKKHNEKLRVLRETLKKTIPRFQDATMSEVQALVFATKLAYKHLVEAGNDEQADTTLKISLEMQQRLIRVYDMVTINSMKTVVDDLMAIAGLIPALPKPLEHFLDRKALLPEEIGFKRMETMPGAYEREFPNATMQLDTRPPHCDRGRFAWYVISKNQILYPIDQADWFPRYVFFLEEVQEYIRFNHTNLHNK